MTETQQVKVEYEDSKGNHTTTVAELRVKWEEETQQWQDNFFHQLETNGKAYSGWASYELI